MIVTGNSQRQSKKWNMFSPRQSPQQQQAGTGFCRSLNDCMSMNQSPHHHPKSKMELQVADLEREVGKEKELRIMYRKRMERTHDYLKYCLQIAQNNGFLDLIVNRNKNDDEIQHAALSSPLIAPAPNTCPHLAPLISQANLNGWHIHHQEIELHDKIGQGSTADIYRATWRGIDVAVKCMYPDFFLKNESGVSFFAQEVDTLSRQRHRFVLQLMGACLDPPHHAWVVTELLGITLKEWVHGNNSGRRKERSIPLPPLEERIDRAVEIAQAMQYLHQQTPKLIHRDLKPTNIFLDDAFHVRVADFGHARFLTDEDMALTGETGTYIYMAPEVIRCEPYDEKCDVYSFAIILNEIITGDHPYIETDFGPSKIAMEVAEGYLRPMLPEDNGKLGELINLICLSWDQDASVRPTFATITSNLKQIRTKLMNSMS
ncbi:serine/threonine-protein kinase STY46-like [Euphorbia lathyris]|uniref:serine/threonine-protein kinase STY46-like n=1 Tax=Euphorbia lathyris TaxID=212925 RepID=UPI0033143EE1